MDKKRLALVVAISLINFNLNKIFQINLLTAFFIFLLSILLFLSTSIKLPRLIYAVSLILFIFIGILILKDNIDPRLTSTTAVETYQAKDRHEYYSEGLGKLYRNRIGLFYFNQLRPVFTNLSQNVSNTLDFSRTFTYPLLFVPLFIIGFVCLLVKLYRFPFIYLGLALIICMFIISGSKLNILLIFPFVNLSVIYGVLTIINILRWKRE